MYQYQANRYKFIIALVALFVVAQSSSVFAATSLENKKVSIKETMSDAALQQALGAVPTIAGAGAQQLVQQAGSESGAAATSSVSGDLSDPDSVLFKANALAQERKLNKQLKASAGVFDSEEITGLSVTPPTLQSLQNIDDSFAKDSLDTSDSLIDGTVSADMRMEAQRNAALSYGARGGLAKRSFEIMERMDDYASVLDKVFDFKSLLIKAPSGMLIEPPIIKESLESMVIKRGGHEAAVADTVLDINKNAKIVSAARNWRQYLVQSWSSKVAPPPKILWPKDDKERLNWKNWVRQGWEAGEKQAEQIFELNTNKLSADYKGMVRYRILLAQGMVSAPYTTHEERGVVGDDNQMRIGDRAVRITEPSRFLTGANIWRPADR